jgi:hypothetical protein
MIKLVINLANAAFAGEDKPFEVARIFEDVAGKFKGGQFDIKKIYDINGNTVGSCAETDAPFKLDVDEIYITLEIGTDNAAFKDDAKDFECARILREAVGKVEEVTDQFVAQNVGRGKVVIHEARRFDTPPKVGDEIDIKYDFGKLHVMAAKDKGNGIDR